MKVMCTVHLCMHVHIYLYASLCVCVYTGLAMELGDGK